MSTMQQNLVGRRVVLRDAWVEHAAEPVPNYLKRDPEHEEKRSARLRARQGTRGEVVAMYLAEKLATQERVRPPGLTVLVAWDADGELEQFPATALRLVAERPNDRLVPFGDASQRGE